MSPFPSRLIGADISLLTANRGTARYATLSTKAESDDGAGVVERPAILRLSFAPEDPAPDFQRPLEIARSGRDLAGCAIRILPPASNRLRDNLRATAAYFSFAYSAFASFRIGMSGSASFHIVRKAWYAARALTASPCRA